MNSSNFCRRKFVVIISLSLSLTCYWVALLPCWWERFKKSVPGEEPWAVVAALCPLPIYTNHRCSYQGVCDNTTCSGWDTCTCIHVQWLTFINRCTWSHNLYKLFDICKTHIFLNWTFPSCSSKWYGHQDHPQGKCSTWQRWDLFILDSLKG